MTLQFVDVEDVVKGRGGKGAGKGVRYAKYLETITPFIPNLKEAIAASKDGFIRIKNKDLGKEMGGEFTKKNETSLYWGLKYSLFDQGIIVETGTHRDGSKILKMRTRDKDDVLPNSLAKAKIGESESKIKAEVVGEEFEDDEILPEE